MGRPWHERGTYGNILKRLIAKQLSQYECERNRTTKTKIAQNIGYLIQVQSGLISSENDIEKRVVELEKIVGVTKKGVITR